MSSAVRLRDAIALLGRFPALAGVDLDVETGEVVLLQGPNGAGKTTLLRLCAGLVSLHSGTGEVLGLDLQTQRRQIRPLVGLLAHNTKLYDDLSIADNVTFWAELAGAKGVGQVDAALERLGLAALADRPVRALSAGQRRRTSIASMVVRRPRLWLLDEPHASLDSEGRDLVDALIAEAIASGATVIVASHELDRVRPIVTRTFTIAGGTAELENSADHADPEDPAGVDNSIATAPASSDA